MECAGAKEMRKIQEEKKDHMLICCQNLLYEMMTTLQICFLSYCNMEELSLLSNCLNHLPSRLGKYGHLRVPLKYSDILLKLFYEWGRGIKENDGRVNLNEIY
jgi:hypothetical protein